MQNRTVLEISRERKEEEEEEEGIWGTWPESLEIEDKDFDLFIRVIAREKRAYIVALTPTCYPHSLSEQESTAGRRPQRLAH